MLGSSFWRRVLLTVAAPALLALSVVLASADSAHAEPAYLSDCGQGLPSPACGSPAARWDASDGAVSFCTAQADRPAWLTADEFRGAVQEAIAAWGAGLALGLRYAGDCGTTWQEADGRNTIAFDDVRSLLAPLQLGVTQPRITVYPASNPTTRTIEEADIILTRDLQVADLPGCFRELLVHEVGHALGLGHSEDPIDLMFHTLNGAEACSAVPSASERAKLQALYGTTAAPAGTPTPAATPTSVATSTSVDMTEAARGTRSARLPATGFALFVFSGGSGADLLTTSGCPAATAAFWAVNAQGDFITYIPGARIAIVNAEWEGMFPSGIPANTALLGRCS